MLCSGVLAYGVRSFSSVVSDTTNGLAGPLGRLGGSRLAVLAASGVPVRAFAFRAHLRHLARSRHPRPAAAGAAVRLDLYGRHLLPLGTVFTRRARPRLFTVGVVMTRLRAFAIARIRSST